MGVTACGGKPHFQFIRIRSEDMIGPPKTFSRLDADSVQPAQIFGIEKLASIPLVVEIEESVVRDSGFELDEFGGAQRLHVKSNTGIFVPW